MRNGYNASSALKNNQVAARRARLFDTFSIEDARDSNDITMRSQIMALGSKMFSEAAQDRRSAAALAQSMSNSQRADLRAQAAAAQATLENNRDFGLRERVQNLAELKNETGDATAMAAAATKGLAESTAIVSDLFAELSAESTIPMLQQAVMYAEDPEQKAAAQATLDSEAKQLSILALEIASNLGVLDNDVAYDTMYRDAMKKLGYGDSASPVSPEDFANVETQQP